MGAALREFGHCVRTLVVQCTCLSWFSVSHKIAVLSADEL